MINIIISFGVVWLIMEFSTIVFYKLPKKHNVDLDKYYLSSYADDMLMNEDFILSYITNCNFSLLFKYYVYGSGVVWRYSKLSKKIDRKFIDLTTDIREKRKEKLTKINKLMKSK